MHVCVFYRLIIMISYLALLVYLLVIVVPFMLGANLVWFCFLCNIKQ